MFKKIFKQWRFNKGAILESSVCCELKRRGVSG